MATDDVGDGDNSLLKVLLHCCICCICRLKTLWYTFASFHNNVEIEVCDGVVSHVAIQLFN